MKVITDAKVWVSNKGGVNHIVAVYGHVNVDTLYEVEALLEDGAWIDMEKWPKGADAIRCDLVHNFPESDKEEFWSLEPDGRVNPPDPFEIEGDLRLKDSIIESLRGALEGAARISKKQQKIIDTIRELTAPK